MHWQLPQFTHRLHDYHGLRLQGDTQLQGVGEPYLGFRVEQVTNLYQDYCANDSKRQGCIQKVTVTDAKCH